MTEKNAPQLAHDVVLRIVESENDIQSILAVIYHEGVNWLDHAAQQKGFQPTADALTKAVQQDSRPRNVVEIDRARVLNGYLNRVQQQLSHGQLLGILSVVNVANRERKHIPMMDFRCEISAQNEQLLRQLLPRIGQQHGFLLNSGRSYHFYGMQLLSSDDWRKFLGKCLLLRNFVDERYVGHQLVDGHCVLRISASPVKRTIPAVVFDFSR